ncbi:cache domain-containing protein, partial [Paracraurococcus lichenis]
MPASNPWRVRARPSFWRALVGATLGLAVAVGAATYVARQREVVLRDAERELQNLGLVLANWVEAGFRSIEQLEVGVLDWIHAEGIDEPGDFTARLSSRDVHEALRARAAALPRVRRLFVTNAEGRTVASSSSWPPPNFTSAGRDFFDALRGDARRDGVLSAPSQSLVDRRWTIYVSRRITAPDGRLLGTVVAAIDLGYFEDLFAGLALGPQSAVGLIQRDGELLAHHPRLERAIGVPIAKSTLLERILSAPKDNVLRGPSPLDGVDRVQAVRSLDGYPLVILATRATDGVLAPWWREAQGIALAVLLVEGLILGIALLTDRMARQRTALHRLALER